MLLHVRVPLPSLLGVRCKSPHLSFFVFTYFFFYNAIERRFLLGQIQRAYAATQRFLTQPTSVRVLFVRPRTLVQSLEFWGICVLLLVRIELFFLLPL